MGFRTKIIAQNLMWTDANTIFENQVLHYLDQYLFESLVKWVIKYAIDRIVINSGFLQHKCATFHLLEGQQQFGTGDVTQHQYPPREKRKVGQLIIPITSKCPFMLVIWLAALSNVKWSLSVDRGLSCPDSLLRAYLIMGVRNVYLCVMCWHDYDTHFPLRRQSLLKS